MSTSRSPLRARVLLAACGVPFALPAQPIGAAFTYQGQLIESGQPATGLFDLQVCLFDSSANPAPIGCAPDFDDVPVEDGVFAIALDFGTTPFAGQQRFLELRVRPGSSTGSFTILAPRQPIRPTPEALRSNVSSAAPWSGLTGVPAGFADGIDDVGGTGTVTSITTGAGLSGGTITGSGTISVADGGIGSGQLANGAVGPAQLADGAVGLAQIVPAQVQVRVAAGCPPGQYLRQVNVDGSVVCGTDAGTSGTVTSITAGTGLSGGTITNNGTIGIAFGGVGPGQIASGAVGTLQLANGAVTGAQLAANAVGSAALADNAVDSGAVQNQAITQTKIASGAVGSVHLANGAVGSAQLAAGAVGTAQINLAQVQARITGACAIGEYFRGINADGSVACEPVPGVPRITVVDDPANPVGFGTSIAIGVDGLPVISYHDDSAGALKVARCANAACSGGATIAVVDDPANIVGLFSSIAIGAGGLPVISYYDATANALKLARCNNVACTAPATITTVDDPANDVGGFSSIAIGANGLPVISYRDSTAGALKVATCPNASCTVAATITTVDDPANDVGFSTSIAIGADGLPVISYRDNTAAALKVAKCANVACTGAATITTVDNPVNSVGSDSSIAIGTDGLPVISYWDISADALKVAKCANAACTGVATITTVDDPANEVGQHSSIAIGADGLPVISYRDTSAGALKLARCNNAACTGAATITTVDDPANLVGSHTSIAIGADGLPVISYQDLSANTLKVVKCGSRSCQ